MPMSPRLLRPRQTIHPEAADWANRVRANGSSVSGTTLVSVSKFCRAIDSAGIRSRFYRLNLFCGGAGSSDTTRLNAALVPLYRGPSVSNTFGSATDTNAGNLFGTANYNETGASGGLAGNGSTQYLQTGLLTSALPQVATGHLAAYCMTGFSASSAYGLVSSFSSGFVGSNYYGIEANSGGVAGTLSGSWGSSFSGRHTATSAEGSGVGFVGVSRTLSTDSRLYRNGSQVGATSATSTTPTANDGGGFAVFAHMAQVNSTANLAAVRMGGYSIGAGLSVAEMAAYYTAMQAFQTALQRNV